MTFGMTAIEGRVGFTVESVEGTAETNPAFELFMLPGNTPDIHLVEDTKFNRKAWNEPYMRGSDLVVWHTEGETRGLLFAPDNGFPELCEVAYGNNWYSNAVYTLAVQDGTKFDRGDLIFGATSKARAEVAKIDTNTLYLVGVQGAFQNAEDLYDYPGGTDYATNAAGASSAVSGYYGHVLEAVNYVSNTGTVKVAKTATRACISDTMIDFAKYQTSPYTAKKSVYVTVADTATTPVKMNGYLGPACICVVYDQLTAAFTVGKKLSAQTGAGDPRVIGTIIDVVTIDETNGYIFAEQDATATAILDNDVLSDNNGTAGAAVANMGTIPAYLNNACKVYSTPESTTQTWNGDSTSFDQTDTLTYTAMQKIFDQKSVSLFVKNAGDDTMVGIGTKIRNLSFDISHSDFKFDVDWLGRHMKYPTSEPAWPGGMTTRAPFGAAGRAIEINGSSSGLANMLMDMTFGVSFEFNVQKGTTLDLNYPNYLQPISWAATGTANVQWKDNTFMKEYWNNPSGKEPVGGAKTVKLMTFALDNGEHVTGSYPYELSVSINGVISDLTLKREESGYIQPCTLEGMMLSGLANSPVRFVLLDDTSSH